MKIEEFWQNVELSKTGCWLWTGTVSGSGYGDIRADGERSAHRWAYKHLVGPIPDGLTLDHLCRNTRCVNPDHLEPVSHRENVRRGVSPSALNAAKTHCIRGHALSGAHVLVNPDGTRDCRLCRRERDRRSWASRSAAVLARRRERRRLPQPQVPAKGLAPSAAE